MNLGEWENGKLKSGTEVERRYMCDIQDNDGGGFIKYSYKDEWRDSWFIHDEADGVRYNKIIEIVDGTKSISEWTFTGKVEVNVIGCINGTVYNADGSVSGYYVNGEYKSADR